MSWQVVWAGGRLYQYFETRQQAVRWRAHLRSTWSKLPNPEDQGEIVVELIPAENPNELADFIRKEFANPPKQMSAAGVVGMEQGGGLCWQVLGKGRSLGFYESEEKAEAVRSALLQGNPALGPEDVTVAWSEEFAAAAAGREMHQEAVVSAVRGMRWSGVRNTLIHAAISGLLTFWAITVIRDGTWWGWPLAALFGAYFITALNGVRIWVGRASRP